MKMAAHLAKMLSMRGMIGAHNQNIVEVDKMKGKPAKMRSIMRWNVEPALRKPKGMQTNSKRLKGVMMAVLGMLSGNISTW